MSEIIFLLIAGFLAGFIDSIAGGGGMITVPSLAAVMGGAAGPGVQVIGTNKIAGFVAAGLALLIYMRRGYLDWSRSLVFTVWVGAGSFFGTRVAPLVPPAAFKGFLAITCPLILWIVLKKDLWIARQDPGFLRAKTTKSEWLNPRLVLSGIACGFYDGIWGPGGGTFMLLSLFLFARLPLLTAIAASKLANVTSALVALASYASGGHVIWSKGGTVAAGAAFGVLIGATQASKQASRIVRPVLLVVVTLLVLKVLISS